MPMHAGRVSLILAFTLSACASIGPATVPRDRLAYVTAVGDSWKEQTLLNIIRMRYGEAPNFLEVASVIASYAFQGSLTAGVQIGSTGTGVPMPTGGALPTGGNNGPASGSLNVGGTYLDRPTITYTPLTGSRFAKSLLQPLPPSAILQLVQSGYPIDRILQLTVQSLGGVGNRSSVDARSADAAFYPLLDALRRLQRAGALTVRLAKEEKNSPELGMLVFAIDRPEVAADVGFVMRALHGRPRRPGELLLVFGGARDGEVAMFSRSLVDILLEVAAGVQVPEADVRDGTTIASARSTNAADPHAGPAVVILSGPDLPARAPYAAVRYLDTWYWISNQDMPSKRAFSFLMMFLSLIETGATPQGPVVTLPDELIPQSGGTGR